MQSLCDAVLCSCHLCISLSGSLLSPILLAAWQDTWVHSTAPQGVNLLTPIACVCRDANIRQRLTAALPQADLDQVSATAARARPAQLIKPCQPALDQALLVDPSLPPVVLVPDAEMCLTHILPAMQRLQQQVYLLLMPPQKQLAQLRSVDALASLWCASVRSRIPSGPVVLAGVGPAGVVAHEMAVQLQRSGTEVGTKIPASVLAGMLQCLLRLMVLPSCGAIHILYTQYADSPVSHLQVPVLLLLENGPLRETADLCSQPWFKLHEFLAGWRPDVDMSVWSGNAKSLSGRTCCSSNMLVHSLQAQMHWALLQPLQQCTLSAPGPVKRCYLL